MLLAHRLRYWTNIKTTLVLRILFAEYLVNIDTQQTQDKYAISRKQTQAAAPMLAWFETCDDV